MKINGRLLIFTGILIALAVICKCIFGPDLDWSGFSPVIAIALFSGMIIKERNASFLLPLLALFISDVAIHVLYKMHLFPYSGMYHGQWKNYLIILSCTLIGWGFKGRNYLTIILGAIAAPTAYFLISNFMVWQAVTEAIYPKNFGGLMMCYEAALPFYRNSVVATILFLPAILFLYNYLVRNKAVVRLG
ncbi:MAG TPA: DUF6580 family putative transport protein [Chitinophagaceae bacterium]|nr:DUF6580 family putative transport protein [Chitinophagaceae bacterium]